MEETFELAGFFGAHAIWCVCDGETLVPMLAVLSNDGKRTMSRLLHERLEDAVAAGKAELERGPEGAASAVLLYDGYIRLPSGRIDAVLVDLRTYDDPVEAATIALPYTKKRFLRRFRVHKPKLVLSPRAAADPDALLDAFWAGVGKHEKGALVWTEFLDESK